MPILTANRIRHAVVFTLVHPEGSDAETDFLAAVGRLAQIPGVEAFELAREVSPKNDFRYGLTMEFADRAAFDAYTDHPEHAGFVDRRWDAEVADFMEIDTVAMEALA
jgi:heme-degrading monooxygenase HmoA